MCDGATDVNALILGAMLAFGCAIAFLLKAARNFDRGRGG